MISIKELIELFKNESCENKIDYEFYKNEPYEDCKDDDIFYELIIYYYTNLYSIEHNEPNELEIVLDNNLKVMGIEFESNGDRVSRTPAWKKVCQAVAFDEIFIIDVEEKVEE